MKKKSLLVGIPVLCLFMMSCEDAENSTTTTIPTSTTITSTVDPTLDVSNVEFSSDEINYDGESHTYEAKGLPTGVYAEYTDNVVKDVGTYYATCKIYNKATQELITELRAVYVVDVAVNTLFEAFCDDFFTLYLGNDYYAWNVFVNQPENLGFNRDEAGKASWYTYTKDTTEDKELAYEDFNNIKVELSAFETSTLSRSQKASYRIIEDFCNYYMTLNDSKNLVDSFMKLNYVDSFGGYVADFASSMEGYNLRRESDIVDMIDYIESTSTAFPTYLTYVSDRDEAGYALSDTTLDEMISYLNDITEYNTKYYLYDVLSNKVDNCTFIEDTAKATYKNRITDALTNNFLPSVKALSTGLAEFKGKLAESDEGYYSQYGEKARVLYELQLEDRLGIDLDMEEYFKYLESNLTKYSKSIDSIIKKMQRSSSTVQNAFMQYYRGTKFFVNINDSEAMLTYLKEFAKSIVPDLEHTPNIILNEMDETVQEFTTAVAYYTKSTVDYMGDEKVTTNPLYLASDLNETLSTLAHEGYPGHLYAYVHAKESDLHNIAVISGVTGHGEGWAKYVELKLLDYIAENATENKEAIKLATSFNYYNQLVSYLLYTYVDCGINYYGWTVGKVKEVLEDNGFDSSGAQDLYNTLIEMPTQYAAYGYGMCYMLQLHNNAKAALGGHYDEKDFNENVVLIEGECGLGRLTELTNEYIAKMKYVYNIK